MFLALEPEQTHGGTHARKRIYSFLSESYQCRDFFGKLRITKLAIFYYQGTSHFSQANTGADRDCFASQDFFAFLGA